MRASRSVSVRRVAGLLVLLLGGVGGGWGCGSRGADRPPQPVARDVTDAPTHDTLPSGVTLRTLSHQGSRYTVATLDLQQVALDLYGQTPEHGAVQTIPALEAWLRTQGRRLVLATNGGIYETDGRPLGLAARKRATRIGAPRPISCMAARCARPLPKPLKRYS